MSQESIVDIASYLRAHAIGAFGSRILNTFPPLQKHKDPVAPRIATLLRKALPAQALAITGTAKYLRKAKAARIVAECGAGKTYMALGTIHVLADGRPSTTLVMCPSHITHKWAREVLLTIPRARAFLIEDLRNGGDPEKGRTASARSSCARARWSTRAMRLSSGRYAADGPQGVAQKRFRRRPSSSPARTRASSATSGSTSFSRQSPDRTWAASSIPTLALPSSIPRRQKLTVSRFRRQGEALGDADSATGRNDALLGSVAGRPQPHSAHGANRVRRAAICGGWFDFAIADELHQLAGDTAQGNGLGVLGRAARKIDRADRHADGRLRRRSLQHLLPHGAARDGARGLCLRRARAARLPGAVRRARNHREGGRRTTPARGPRRRRFRCYGSPEHRRCCSASS